MDCHANKYKAKAVKAYPQWEDKIKCNHLIYGVVTLEDAKDMHGNKFTVENYPCVWRAKGSAYQPVQDAFKTVKPFGSFVKFNMIIKPKRESNDGTTYWIPVISWDTNTKLDVDTTVAQTFAEFENVIASENEGILAQYNKARSAPSKSNEFDAEDSSDLANDFVDDDVIEGDWEKTGDELPENFLAAG